MPDDIQVLLNNSAPIDAKDPRYRQLLDDVQCNILTPHRRRRANYFFIRFRDGEDGSQLAAKYLIGLLARNGLERATVVTAVRNGTSLLPATFMDAIRSRTGAPVLPTTAEQLAILKDITVGSELKALRRNVAPPNGFATNFLLTRLGCAKLQTPVSDAAFNEGQAARWQRLNDPEPVYEGQSRSWDARYDEAHAVLVVAYDPKDGAAGVEQTRVLDVLRAFLGLYTELIAEEKGHLLRRSSDGKPIEAFGFRDGISQPRLLTLDFDAQRPAVWNDFVPLNTVLTPDPHGRLPHACGSYFVFRKLRQDVAGFHRQVKMVADSLRRPPADVLAEMVGRRPSGQPLVAAEARSLNDFDFSNDQNAKLCPGYAHIRKVNPRGDIKAIYGAGRRRIVRRGLAFGPELARHDDGLPNLETRQSGDPVGMLFFCAQADIAEQFEHLQAYWANNSQTPRALAPGPDAIAGQTGPREVPRIAACDLNGRTEYLDYPSHVEMRGGVYLFAPSISFLKSLLDDLWT